ncbi:fungal-specific transcription factor domain-containing protein [Lasiosphaeris hirsuta]|uniref:Fungal-specific transcription factor domain-containing protein n=1 Tax=Lasiosphaeris hirsuta TaxID=260670 RepID=A0AA40AGU6_9PEZI|nr:fungal-specific transcription factor domain-containing protein [Lasiosphaeris hirsuta]
MKNKQKSRSGCRTCKLRRPACRNCSQKGFECPGYQQRLQWSTKHERPWNSTTSGPENFNQLVSAASESIAHPAGEQPRQSSNGPASAATSDCGDSLPHTTPSPSPPSDTSYEDGSMVMIKRDSSPVLGNIPEAPIRAPLLQPVVDIPSFLIEHWFKSVCASWSAYDSQSNPYRQLTSVHWSTSTPVFYALQAISAASLVERLPHVMKETARAAPRMATEAIKKELMAFSTGGRQKFPSQLLLSLFCMSSSMCWLESRELGLQYLRQARAVLKFLEKWDLDEKEQQLLEFFNGCLIYEEMLRSVVSENEIDLSNMLSWPEPTQVALVPGTPHAWTGVSSDVFRLFGKAIALCRRSRTRWRHNDGTSYRALQGAMKDIEEATAIEEALLAVDAEQIDHSQLSEIDKHLYDAAEAYRLSSLLQLYESFPDLITKRIPDLAVADGTIVWNTWVSPLALHVANILETIPVASMRCIQPLLCLCAGSGLRFESKVPLRTEHQTYLLNLEHPCTSLTSAISTCPETEAASSLPAGVPENSVKTSQARQFIMERLEQLELSLPPKPIGVAKQLLRAVWSAYDEEIGTPRRTHWLDVMSNTGLHSLFG